MRPAMHRLVTAACLDGMALGTGAVLHQSSFTAPLAERAASDVHVSLERAIAQTVTPEWLLPRLEEALAEGDRDRVVMLANLADDSAIALPASLPDQIAAFDAAHGGGCKAPRIARFAPMISSPAPRSP